MSDLRQRAIQGIKRGDSFAIERTFSQQDTAQFGELTRDYNPVHYEPRFANGRGFPQLILPGLLTGSMLCEIGGQFGWLATKMSFAFKKPVFFGDTITCRLTITELDEQNQWAAAAVRYTNQHDQLVATAKLSGLLPNAQQRQVLTNMVEQGDPTNALRDEGES